MPPDLDEEANGAKEERDKRLFINFISRATKCNTIKRTTIAHTREKMNFRRKKMKDEFSQICTVTFFSQFEIE
jgi:hypothetical protein